MNRILRSSPFAFNRPPPALLCAAAILALVPRARGGDDPAGAAVAAVAAATTVAITPAVEDTEQARLVFGPIVSGYAYTVETCSDLAAANWTALEPDQLTDIGGKRALTDPTATNTHKFYRVSVTAQPPAQLRIRTDQPRLFWNPQIAANVYRSDKATDRERFLSFVRRQRMDIPDGTDPALPLDPAAIRLAMQSRIQSRPNGEFAFDAMSYGLSAFLARTTGSPFAAHHQAYTEAYLEALLDRPFSFFTGDLGPRDKLFALGVIYDWLGTELPAELRHSVHLEAIDLLDDIEATWHSYSSAQFSGGHSRYANVVALAALLAIRQGIEAEDASLRQRYFAWLGRIVGNWRSGYNPTQAWMAQDGGQGMGWAYGFSYTSIEPYVMWDNATTEERWTGDWLRERASLLLYGARNSAPPEESAVGAYDPFPYSGNVWSTGFDIINHGTHLLLADDHATSSWLYGQLASRYRYNYWPDVLYRRPDIAATPPTDRPLARYFGPSGYVLMRDRWDLDDNTLLEFKSTSYYCENHHHRDQNAFTIFFRGPLAIDSGGYNIFGGYGSVHAVNYYSRSIAHNTVLVYDPDEDFKYGGAVRANDGGQQFAVSPRVEYSTLAQMQPGGTNALGGVLAFENNDRFAYTLGDATKAYAADKLSDFRRSIVYLRNFAATHPVVVVHDRVVATNPSFAKTYLLHSINQPVITGQSVAITIDDGTTGNNRPAGLIQQTVLPADATLTAVGGIDENGVDRRFWVADDGTDLHQGRNYSDGMSTAPSDLVAIREAGQWRVEVKPGSARTADSFLHVLTVGAGPSITAASVTPLASVAGLDGLVVKYPTTDNATCLVFNHGSAPVAATLNLSLESGVKHLIVVGLTPSERYAVTFDSSGLHLHANPAGTKQASDQGVLTADFPL